MLKVKVGGKAGPSEDAARTVELLRGLTPPSGGDGSSSTVRLDANQAWTLDEALLFSSTLATASSAAARTGKGGGGSDDGGGRRSGGVVVGDGGVPGGSGQAELPGVDLGLVEYIEEPLRDPRSLGTFWKRSGRVLPYALDESLGMGRESFTDKVSGRFACFVSFRMCYRGTLQREGSELERCESLWRRCD